MSRFENNNHHPWQTIQRLSTSKLTVNNESKYHLSPIITWTAKFKKKHNDDQNLSSYDQSNRNGGVLNEELGLYDYPDKWWVTIDSVKEALTKQPSYKNDVDYEPRTRNGLERAQVHFDNNTHKKASKHKTIDKNKFRSVHTVSNKYKGFHGLKSRVSLDDNLKRIIAEANEINKANKGIFKTKPLLRHFSRKKLKKLKPSILHSCAHTYNSAKSDIYAVDNATIASQKLLEISKLSSIIPNGNKTNTTPKGVVHRFHINYNNGSQNHSINLFYNKRIETTQLNVSGSSINYADAINIADEVMNYLTRRPYSSVDTYKLAPGHRQGLKAGSETTLPIEAQDAKGRSWFEFGWTTVEPSNYINEMKRMMSVYRMGYFSISLIHLCTSLYAKPDNLVHLLCLFMEKEYTTLLEDDRILVSFGPKSQKVFEHFAIKLKTLPTEYVKSQALVLYHSIIHRREFLPDDVNSIMDYIDSLYLDDEGIALFESVENFQNYQNHSGNPFQILRTISKAIFAPYKRLAGSHKRHILTDSLEKTATKYSAVLSDGIGHFSTNETARRGWFSNKTRFSVIHRESPGNGKSKYVTLPNIHYKHATRESDEYWNNPKYSNQIKSTNFYKIELVTKMDHPGNNIDLQLNHGNNGDDTKMKIHMANSKITTKSKNTLFREEGSDHTSKFQVEKMNTESWTKGANIDFEESDYYNDDDNETYSKFAKENVKTTKLMPNSKKPFKKNAHLLTSKTFGSKMLQKQKNTKYIEHTLLPIARFEDYDQNIYTKSNVFNNMKIVEATLRPNPDLFGKKKGHKPRKTDGLKNLKSKTGNKEGVLEYTSMATKVNSKNYFTSRNIYSMKATTLRSHKKLNKYDPDLAKSITYSNSEHKFIMKLNMRNKKVTMSINNDPISSVVNFSKWKSKTEQIRNNKMNSNENKNNDFNVSDEDEDIAKTDSSEIRTDKIVSEMTSTRRRKSTKPETYLKMTKRYINMNSNERFRSISKKYENKYRALGSERFSISENYRKNKITDLTSYSDEEESLKFHIDDALRHDGKYFNPARRHNEQDRFTSYSNEEFVLKSNLYKVLGFKEFSNNNDSVIKAKNNLKP